MKYQQCQTACGYAITNVTNLDQGLVSVSGRHSISLTNNQTFFSNVDVRGASSFPVYAPLGSVLFFQHFYQQNIYNGRVAVEFNAAYSDYRTNCTPNCFTNYKLGDGQNAQPWRFLVRAIVSYLKSKWFR